MDLQKIITDCDTLETTISVLIKDNSSKETELALLQDSVFETTKAHLDATLNRENELQCKLDERIARLRAIENEIKQYATINEKLSELVSTAQRRSSQDVSDDAMVSIAEAQEEFATVMLDYNRVCSKLRTLENNLHDETRVVYKLIRENSQVLVDMHRNDNLIRVMEQQNKYAEQQFDLTLNQLPWEPLAKQYLDSLAESSNQQVRELAATCQVQANEIEELNESLNTKKKKKLEALENLLAELGCFIQKRDEAVTIAKLN